MDIDVSEVLKLGTDFRDGANLLIAEVKGPVSKGALKIKNAMQADLAESPHFKQVARAVSYETRSGVGWAEAQIGPVTTGATVGDLAHFAYFGGAYGGGNTVRDPLEAAEDERDAFEAALAAVVDRLLG